METVNREFQKRIKRPLSRTEKQINRRKQIGGDHYSKHKIQPWDIIDEYNLDYYDGNALKYLLRRKDPTKRVEDLKKAIHYLEKSIQNEENRNKKDFTLD